VGVEVVHIDRADPIDRPGTEAVAQVALVESSVVVEGIGCEVLGGVLEPPLDDVVEARLAAGFDPALADVEDELGADPLGIGPSAAHRADDPAPGAGQRVRGGLEEHQPRVRPATTDVAGAAADGPPSGAHGSTVSTGFGVSRSGTRATE
jgi:hypothetical protein